MDNAELAYKFVMKRPDGSLVRVYLREPTEQEIKRLMTDRFVRRGGRAEDRSYEARIRFFDTVVLDIQEQNGDGAWGSIPKEQWTETRKVPPKIKTSVAYRFEEEDPITEEEEKN